MNAACSYNCYDEYRKGKCAAIAEVIVSHCTAHYVCLGFDGKYYDPTLSYAYEHNKFYLHKIIDIKKDNFRDSGERLMNFKKEMVQKLPWYLRLLCKPIHLTDIL